MVVFLLVACAKPAVNTISPATPNETKLTAAVEQKAITIVKAYRTAAVGKINSLDPSVIETASEKIVISNLIDTLFQRNQITGEIVPRACESYEVSPDGLSWKFFLRKDLFWSTGKKIKAKDFEIALRRLLKPKTGAKIAKKLIQIQGATEVFEGAFYNPDNVGISSVDNVKQSELNIVLTKPDPLLIQTLSDPATAPIPADDYDSKQDGVFDFDHYVSSGPFVITKKSPTSYVLKKNNYYRFSSNIQIDEVRFSCLTSVFEGEKMFLSGLLDQFGYVDLAIGEETLTKLSGTDYVFFQPDLRTVFLRLNINQPPFDQFQLRQALAVTFNSHSVIDKIGFEGEVIAQSLVPDQVKFYDAPHGYYANPSSGKEMLEKLGYCDQKDCSTLPGITLLYPNTNSMKKIALQIQAQFKESLNTKQIQVKPVDVNLFFNEIEKGNYVMALDEIAVGQDDLFGFLHSFVTGNVLSGGYSNPEYDRVIQQAFFSTNFDDMKKNYREAESTLLRDIAVIPVLFKSTPILLQKHIMGFVPNPWDIHPFENISLK